MAKQKPTIPKGTRDFSPEVMVRRNYIFDVIRQVFQKYAYQPLETPSMENLSTLLGKYGEEGDKLLFKILNSGDYLSKVDETDLKEKNSQKLSSVIAEKGLRYDLTVPFARYIVQHRNEITLPFKRYQIQPVWRADKPQKGRYREFYQCDGDVIGTDSLLNEVELIQIIDDVFRELGLKVVVKINNRKILKGLANFIQNPEKFMDITIAIDKLEKIGREKVKEEMVERGVDRSSADRLDPFLQLQGKNHQKLDYLEEWLTDEEGNKGIIETREILEYLNSLDLIYEVEFDPKLARGLDYYTGTIFEVKALDAEMGSICGGGRYDDLTGVFGLKDISGVGISFGAERIYDVMEKLDLFPPGLLPAARIMFVNFGKEEAKHALAVLQELRKEGIQSEIYPDAAKMKKQMTYANNKGVEYVAMMGENEIRKQVITIKHMATGEQKEMTLEELKDALSQ
jgi:histidyl-tRNA synthetase